LLCTVMGKKKEQKQTSRRRRNILLGVLLIGGVAWWWLRNQAARISIGGNTTRVHKVSLTEIELRTVLVIINESDIPVMVSGFLGQIFYQNSSLGIVQQLKPVEIGAFQTSTVEFSSKISSVNVGLEFWDEIKRLIQTGQNTIDLSKFSIRGTLKAANLSIPVNQKLLA
jgi:hypothetical protein